MGSFSLIEYLKDPYLVARFQARFGIVRTGIVPKVKKDEKPRRSHKRNRSDLTDSGIEVTSCLTDGSSNDEEENIVDRYVTNKWWYYLFLFGTALGDEIFYASFFSFWFWNVDGAVGRRVVFVWALCMYIGQGLKDVIRWPRPVCPPVLRLERKWELEYGMPSTHAIVASAVPFSIIIFTATRYQYPVPVGIAIACIWCALVCCSRIYLGMHSVLDIFVGLGLVALLLPVMIPTVDFLDPILLQSPYGGFLLFMGGVILAHCTPGGDRWTPARGDTMVILGSCVGLNLGAWVNFQTGVIRGPPMEPPYAVLWPGLVMLGQSVIRLVIGLCIVVATRAIVKSATYAIIRSLLKMEDVSYLAKSSKKEIWLDLASKFLQYTAIGFNVVYLSPAVFRFLDIERPTFHTEV